MKVTYIGPHDAVDVPVPEGAPDLEAGGVVTVDNGGHLDTTAEHAAQLLDQVCWAPATDATDAKKAKKQDAAPAEEGD